VLFGPVRSEVSLGRIHAQEITAGGGALVCEHDNLPHPWGVIPSRRSVLSVINYQATRTPAYQFILMGICDAV
jgi:hypothetical protein